MKNVIRLFWPLVIYLAMAVDLHFGWTIPEGVDKLTCGLTLALGVVSYLGGILVATDLARGGAK